MCLAAFAENPIVDIGEVLVVNLLEDVLLYFVVFYHQKSVGWLVNHQTMSTLTSVL
jgi:hypothetical protein